MTIIPLANGIRLACNRAESPLRPAAVEWGHTFAIDEVRFITMKRKTSRLTTEIG